MQTDIIPRLCTPGKIAEDLNVALPRVLYVLSTRRIQPIARAGNARLYSREAVAEIRRVLAEIDAKRQPVAEGGAR